MPRMFNYLLPQRNAAYSKQPRMSHARRHKNTNGWDSFVPINLVKRFYLKHATHMHMNTHIHTHTYMHGHVHTHILITLICLHTNLNAGVCARVCVYKMPRRVILDQIHIRIIYTKYKTHILKYTWHTYKHTPHTHKHIQKCTYTLTHICMKR